MTVPTRYEDLRTSARNAGRTGRYKDGALFNEQAYNIAKQYQMPLESFSAGVWAADYWRAAGEPLKALRLITEILHSLPAQHDPYDVFITKSNWIDILEATNPELGKLEQHLESLEVFVRENPQLTSAQTQIYLTRSNILEDQGRYSEALEQRELAWTNSGTSENFSWHKGNIAFNACVFNLKLGRRDAAGRWCSLLSNDETTNAWNRAYWYEACFNLALWDQDYVESDLLSRKYEEYVQGFQGKEYPWQSINLRVRALLVRQSDRDPADRHNLARHLLSRIRKVFYNASRTYEYRLLQLDYRLAALRYIVGVKPVDDLWYTAPQTIPNELTCPSVVDFQERMFRVRGACDKALDQAKYLDRCFECDWRQIQIRGRLERVDEIAKAVGKIPSPAQEMFS